MSTLALRGIVKRFGAATILEGLSVEIPLTGITFIVGASGSGKSVLCRLAVGLLKPDEGEVFLFGERVDTMPERKLQPAARPGALPGAGPGAARLADACSTTWPWPTRSRRRTAAPKPR